MKYNITKLFGNFDVTATAVVETPEGTSELVHECIRKGLLYVLERTPSSAVEQKVFAPLLGWEMNEAGTSYKRPAGWERSSVPYSTELAESIRKAYNSSPGKMKVGDESVEIMFTVLAIIENESDGGASRKMATEMAGKLDAGMKLALGVKDDDTEAQVVEKCHTFLASLRAKKTKKTSVK